MDSPRSRFVVNSFLPALVALSLTAWAVGQGPVKEAGVEGDRPVKTLGVGDQLPPGKTPVLPGSGQQGTGQNRNSWFENTDLDLGTYFHHEHAVGKYKFKNPTDKVQEWRNLTGSCTCSQAFIRFAAGTGDGVVHQEFELTGKPASLYRVTQGPNGPEKVKVTTLDVPPGAEGEVEVHMEMNGITGVREASLDIYTTDPELPLSKLKFRATGAVMFQLVPNEVNLNKMTWNQQKDWSVQVTSPVQKDFNITGHDPLPPDMTVAYEKVMNGDTATWTIRGTYGPLKAETGGGGVINFRSDLRGNPTFQVRVLAFVEGPLEVKPGTFLTMGMIKHGTEKVSRVSFEPNDGTDLEAVTLRFEKLSVDEKFVTARTIKEGKVLHVEVDISKDAPTGLLRGDLVVELNHPAIKEKRILFNGFVR